MVCSQDMDDLALFAVRSEDDRATFHFPVTNTVQTFFEEVGRRMNYNPDTFELSLNVRKPTGYELLTLNDVKDKTIAEAGICAEPGLRYAVSLLKLKGIELRRIDETPLINHDTSSVPSSGDNPTSPEPPPLPPQVVYPSPSDHVSSSSSLIIQPSSSSLVPYVGLVNQAMTCYLNSLLQALFMTPEFRNALYKWEYDGSAVDEAKSMPYQLQKLFLNLQTSSRASVETTSLTRSFGWDSSEAWQQHDIQELCRVMFDALEQKFKDTDQADLINSLYEGTMTDYVKCLECSTEKHREDKFLDIPLPVRQFGSTVAYSSVEEALRAFVQPEILEGNNQYFCERCDKKCDAHKGLKFTKFPYLLTLHLKRFDFDYNTLNRIKLNDKVRFPERLNLNSFIQQQSAGDSPACEVVEEITKCDDASTTDSGSALDDDSCPVDAPITNHVDDQEDDEGIDIGHLQESEKALENSSESGPYVYDLFSIMIHSGSATGGHYYAYIKDFATGEWYCFNDQTVSRITQEDIQKTYGSGRGYYSGAYTSSTNAYMLMYRQIDTERNAQAMTSSDFPPHILELLKRMEEEKERESWLREKELGTVRLKYWYYPANSGSVEHKLFLPRDTTLRDTTIEAWKTANLEYEYDISQCRLVLFNKAKELIEKSFEGQDDMSIRDVFEGANKVELLLEVRSKDEEFQVHRPGDINTKVMVVNPANDDLEDGMWTVRGNLNSTVEEYRHNVAKELNLDASNIQMFLEKCNSDPRHLDMDEMTLKFLDFCYSSRVFVVPTPVEDFTAVYSIIEQAKHIITLFVSLFNVASAVKPRRRRIRVYSDTRRKAQYQIQRRDVSPQPLPDPEDPIAGPSSSDQSASEDSSLTDSERTIVGEAPGENLTQVSPSNSPVGWEHNVSSPEDDNNDVEKSLTPYEFNQTPRCHVDEAGDQEQCDGEYYFYATSLPEPNQTTLRVLLDKRMTLSELKDHLQPYAGVPVDNFKLFRITNGQETECLRPKETLQMYRDEERLVVRPGRALRCDETTGRVYLLAAKDPEPERFLFEWVIARGASVRDVKADIVEEAKRIYRLDIPLDRCRLRMKQWKEPTRPYLDNSYFDDIAIGISNWDIYLQELDGPETVARSDQRLVFVRHWCPSTLTLQPFTEIVLDSHLVSELKQKISDLSGIPIESVQIARGQGAFSSSDMTVMGIHSDLEWNPDAEYLEDRQLHIDNDGVVVIYRDAREKLKQMTPEERKEILSQERGKTNKIRTMVSPRKERALKIHLYSTPPRGRQDIDVD